MPDSIDPEKQPSDAELDAMVKRSMLAEPVPDGLLGELLKRIDVESAGVDCLNDVNFVQPAGPKSRWSTRRHVITNSLVATAIVACMAGLILWFQPPQLNDYLNKSVATAVQIENAPSGWQQAEAKAAKTMFDSLPWYSGVTVAGVRTIECRGLAESGKLWLVKTSRGEEALVFQYDNAHGANGLSRWPKRCSNDQQSWQLAAASVGKTTFVILSRQNIESFLRLDSMA